MSSFPLPESRIRIAPWAPVLAVLLLVLLTGIATGEANRRWFLTLHHAATGVPEDVWAALTFSADTLAAMAIASLLAIRYPSLLWSGLLAALVGALITHGIKPWLALPRPAAVLPPELLHVIGQELKSNAFPSGHTLTAFVLASLWAAQMRASTWRYAIFAAAILVGASRIAVGAHWPADVIAGALGGMLAAWMGQIGAAHWRAGMSCRGYALLLMLYLGCCIALWFHDGGYPQARWLAQSLSAAGAAACVVRLHAMVARRRPGLAEHFPPAWGRPGCANPALALS